MEVRSAFKVRPIGSIIPGETVIFFTATSAKAIGLAVDFGGLLPHIAIIDPIEGVPSSGLVSGEALKDIPIFVFDARVEVDFVDGVRLEGVDPRSLLLVSDDYYLCTGIGSERAYFNARTGKRESTVKSEVVLTKWAIRYGLEPNIKTLVEVNAVV